MKRLLAIVALVTFGLPAQGPAQSSSTPPTPSQDDESTPAKSAPAKPSVVPAEFVGRWKSGAYELFLSSELARSVYGPNATSARVTEMVVAPSGQGTITITRKVVNRRGRVVPGTLSIEELQFVIGAPEEKPGLRPRYPGEVTRAERRYPDNPNDKWPIDRVRVEVIPFNDGDRNKVEIHVDGFDPNLSFWETLQRVGAGNQTGARRNTAKS
jgi:hypothetical protein